MLSSPSSPFYQRIDLTLLFTTKHANIRALPQIYHGEERPGNLVTNYLAVQPDPSPKSGKCGEGLGTRLVWFLDRSCMQPKEYDGSRAWNGLKMIQYSRILPLQTICAHVLCIKLSSYADTELSCKVQLSCCNHFCSISTHCKKHHQSALLRSQISQYQEN